MRRRSGFTLIELVVAMALLLILTSMAASSFSVILASTRANQNREQVVEDMSIVMDQLTKELRQASLASDSIGIGDGGRATFGVTLPTWTSASDTSRALGTVVSSPTPQPSNPVTLAPVVPALSTGQTLVFRTSTGTDPNGIVLEFFTVDQTGIKHRIRYSLTAPSTGSTYTGAAQQYWADSHYEPCEIAYCNNTWSASPGSWSTEPFRPVTGQEFTNFTVIRPAWSANVVQVVLEAKVKGGGSVTTIRRIMQVALGH